MSFPEPNVNLPLASSYNERGVKGFTNSITNAIDQLKFNSIYEPVKNAITGKTTLYLSKRPGVTDGGMTIGDSTQTPYMAIPFPTTNPWVVNILTNAIRVSDSAAVNTTLFTDAAYRPTYFTRMLVSGVENIIVQTSTTAGVTKNYYASAIGSWTEITDADFPAATLRGKLEPMDGYLFALASDNYIYNSDPNSVSAWTSGNKIMKQIQQDAPRGLIRFGNQIIALGVNTAEVFVNTGNPTGSPLSAVKQRFSRTGLAMNAVALAGRTSYYATIGNKLYMVGRQEGGPSCLISYNGETWEKISPSPIEKILSETDWFSVNSVSFQGRTAIAIGFSGADWMMYFPDWNEWFQWTSSVFSPVNSASNNFGGGYHLGVANPHKVFQFLNTTENFQDDGANYAWKHQFMLPKNGNHRKFMSMFGLSGDTARSAQNIVVQFSDDDWQTFQTGRNIDMTSQDKMLTRCGSYKNRGVTLSYTGALDVRLESVLARIE